MKILITSTDLMMTQFLVPHVKNLAENGFEIDLACSNVGKKIEKVKEMLSSKVSNIFEVKLSRSPFNVKNVVGYKQLKSIIRNGGYNFIWTNEPVVGIMTRLAARRSRKKGTKLFYFAHGFHFYKGAPKKNWLLWYPIEKFFSRLTDKIVLINEEDYLLAKSKFHCEACHIHGIGVDGNRFSPVSEQEKKRIRNELQISENKFVILCVGELNKNKDQITAIKAVELLKDRHPNILLLLAGVGKERHNLEKYVFDAGLMDNIKFLGYCTNLQDYQKATDLVVSCSIREGLGFNVIEAMLTNNPVIATDNRGHRELIENGKRGFLINCKDYLSLAKKTTVIIEDEKIRNMVAVNGYEFARQYTLDNVKKELKEIYDD